MLKVGAARAGPAGGEPALTFAANLLNPPLFAGLAMWVFSAIAWILVLNRAPLGIAYASASVNYVIVPSQAT